MDETKPAPKADSVFNWDNPTSGTDKIWKWDQGNVKPNPEATQPTNLNASPTKNNTLIDFGEMQPAPVKTQSNTIQNLYKQPVTNPAPSTMNFNPNPNPTQNTFVPMGGINFGGVNNTKQRPVGGNMNNFSPPTQPAMNQNFMTPTQNPGYNAPMGSVFQNPTTQSNNNGMTNGSNQFNFGNNNTTQTPPQSKPVPKPNQVGDGFDDFQTAKANPSQNEYKGFNELESSLIDLNDLQIAEDKKKKPGKKDDDIDSLFPVSPSKDNKFGGNATGTFNMGNLGSNIGAMGNMGNMGGTGYVGNNPGFVPMSNNPMMNNNPMMMNNNNMGMGYNQNMMNRGGFGMNMNPGNNFPQQQGFGVGFNQKPF